MTLVDTSVWIDYFNLVPNPQVQKLEVALRRDEILIGDLILCELLQGFRTEAEAAAVREALSEFAVAPLAGYDIAVKAAANYRRLRELGVTVRKTIDLLIGTFCIEHGHTLLHADRDFDLMARHLGLQTL